MSHVIAIDPGPEQSAIVCWNRANQRLEWCRILANSDLRHWMMQSENAFETVAIEMIASYGMAVGREVFETCLWIGRLVEICEQRNIAAKLCFRKDIKLHLCGIARAKDPNIRQALIDRIGIVGTRKQPGPLFGITSHSWAALAVAIYASET